MKLLASLLILVCFNAFDANGKMTERLLSPDAAMIAQLQAEIQDIKACISKPGVAFTVQMNTHKPTLGSKQLIGFDKITTNIGHAFNNNTSVFTAPVGGMYVFEVVVGTDGHATTDLEIVKNGVYLKRVYGYSYNHWGTSTASVTTHLVSGDQVYVKNNVNNHGLVGHQLTSFSGYLVKPDCNFS